MIIAIDHGNSAIKTPVLSFTSGLVIHDEIPPAIGDVICYRERYYTLSEERIPYLRDKSADERFFILTLFAIAKTLEREGYMSGAYSIDLAVGLPPEHFKPLRESFERYLKGNQKLTFTYNTRQYHIEICNVFIYPQGFAAIVPYLSGLDITIPVYLLDIGGYTADIMLFRNGKPDLNVCSSLDMGAIMLCNRLSDEVNARFGVRITEEHIKQLLTGGRTLLPDAVCSYIKDSAAAYTDKLLSTLRERQIDLVSNQSYFSGGGSLLLRPWIERSPLTNAPRFITDTRANAIGYRMLAERQKAQQAKSCAIA